MHVPEKARRSVIFIGSKNEHGAFIPRATGFLVLSHSKGDDHALPHLVTAEHVISGMQSRGIEIFCRINLKNGGAEVLSLSLVDHWYFHPDTSQMSDVAVATVGINLEKADHDYIPIPEYVWNEGTEWQVKPPGLGDEIFIIGLFRSHYGAKRNRPIIRIGNISAMPEEPVFTEYAGYIDAYLIEARSIAGLSGSPVFVNSSQEFPANFIPDPRFKVDPDEVNWTRYHFLGLIHGHFDLKNLTEDSVVEDAAGGRGINSGIGLVIPASKVLETLYQPELKKLREKAAKAIRTQRGAVADIDSSPVIEG